MTPQARHIYISEGGIGKRYWTGFGGSLASIIPSSLL